MSAEDIEYGVAAAIKHVFDVGIVPDRRDLLIAAAITGLCSRPDMDPFENPREIALAARNIARLVIDGS